MKRLLFILFVACSMLPTVWGQNPSLGSSPFIGEWTGVFRRNLHWGDGVYKESKLVLRIESYGGQLGIRVKLKSADGKDVDYRTWKIVDVTPHTLQLTYKEGEFPDDNGGWFWYLFHYTLIYDNGRLQLISKGADECTRKHGTVTSTYNPNIGGDSYDMYLYKNGDDW